MSTETRLTPEFVAEVASHLPGTWDVVADVHGRAFYRLERCTDRLPIELHPQLHPKTGRMCAALGCHKPEDPNAAHTWPHDVLDTDDADRRSNLDNGRISVAPTTSAERFAKAIERRLLPHAERAWPIILAHVAEAQGYADTTKTTAERLRAAGCQFRDADNRSTSEPHGYPPAPCNIGGTQLRVSGRRVTFDRMTVDVEQALAILSALRPISVTKKD